ncbi:hypothetical protein DL240_09150 [Lujinxingia litoralis]|uniref:Uncharacterized protein n=1 Tax=Lujinxingia litoralis TaxID=2211119 RepID=A0A328C7I4_9DELT|nr:hypothetical protein [Lujinxingia litoralis]RAL23042.1 hypothetical protein DL240_09150 [Lujinxingia litoralis]
MNRPTEEIEWAEDPGAEVDEPDALRPSGFPFGFVPAAQQINWMWRTVGRWVKWLANKSDNHVHDGGSGELSAPKVNLKEHINWGEGGEFKVTLDRDSIDRVHEITHRCTDINPSSFTRFISDEIQTKNIGLISNMSKVVDIYASDIDPTSNSASLNISTFSSDGKVNMNLIGNLYATEQIEGSNTPKVLILVHEDGQGFFSLTPTSRVSHVDRTSQGHYIVKIPTQITFPFIQITPQMNFSSQSDHFATYRSIINPSDDETTIYIEITSSSGTSRNAPFILALYSSYGFD